MWRLVLERVATLTELDTTWCLRDMLTANEALDIQAEVRQKAEQKRG